MESNRLNTDKHNDVTVIVLAGGKSTRMGSDKGMLPFQESSLGEKVISTANEITDNVVVSVNISNQEDYSCQGVITVVDEIPEQGPIGGIVSIAPQISTNWFLVLTIDCPLFTTQLFEVLWNNKQDKEAVVFSHQNRLHPLLALYHRSTIPFWNKAFLAHKLRVTDLVKSFDCEIIELDVDQAELLVNINTLLEYKELKTR